MPSQPLTQYICNYFSAAAKLPRNRYYRARLLQNFLLF
jgi:hypothetical protein